MVLDWINQASNTGEIVVGLPRVPEEMLDLFSEVGRTAETFALARLIAHYQTHTSTPTHVTVRLKMDFEDLA